MPMPLANIEPCMRRDCTFPGIGLPAVAASGTIAANSLVNPFEHWSMLQRIGT